MIAVSDDFKAAVESEIRQWKCRAVMEFGGSSVSPPTVVGTPLNEDFDGQYAADGRVTTVGKIGFVGSRVFPSDLGEEELLPAGPENGTGFWGDQFSDSNGYLNQTLTLEWEETQRIGQIWLHFDSWLGYARDFEISYYDGSWHSLTTVTNNTSLLWTYTTTGIEATKLRATFTRIQYADENVRVIEFSVQWLEDISDRVNSWMVKKERYYTDESLPVPNASANSLDLVLDNSDHAFYRKNSGSPYYGCLKANQRVWLYLQLLVNGVYEEIPVGVFYTTKWKSTRDSIETQVTLLDRAKRLMDSTYATSRVLLNQKISEVAELILQDAGLNVSEYEIDDTGEDSIIPYVWFDTTSHWNALTRLAEAEGGKVWVDEYDKVIFENRERLTGGGAVATLQYNKHFGDANDDWDESQMRNFIRVTATPLRIAANAEEDIWVNPWSATMPAGGTHTFSVTFTASTNIRQPIFGPGGTADLRAEWLSTPSPTGGTIRLRNTGSTSIPLQPGDIIVKGKPVKAKVWESGETYSVPPGGYVSIEVFFNSMPCIEVDDPELDGWEGAGLSLAWKVSPPYAFGGVITVTNSSAYWRAVGAGDIWVRAKVLEPVGTIKVEKKDDDLIAIYGKRTFSWESKFLQSRDLATDLATYLLATYKDPTGAIMLDQAVRGMPHLQLCDRVHVEDPVKLHIDADYFVTGISLTWGGGLDGQLELLPA